MSSIRYEFKGTLEVLSPLHVGSGEFREVAAVKGKKARNGTVSEEDKPEVAAIVRDHDKRPYIPATAIKGVLRRVAEQQLDTGAVEALFGQAKNDASGRMGAILFRGATLTGEPPNTEKLPYGKMQSGVFVSARAKIDSASGTADDHKLYFQEMVAPDTKFCFRLVLTGRDTTKIDAHAKALVKILISLTADEGISLGKGVADGQGRLRLLSETVHLKRLTLNTEGDFQEDQEDDAAQLWSDAVAAPVNRRAIWKKLRFQCSEPFAILDSSWEPPKGQAADNISPQLRTQQDGKKLPLILGSSVTGAMRARACWLLALDAHQETPPRIIKDDEHIVRVAADISQLFPDERLFGVTGFRALLGIQHLDVNKAEPFEITSVKLDRFSGAPIDNALFKSAVFINTEFTLHLDLRSRPGAGALAQSDEDFAERLIKDICANGLELGHGANKGFGWFTVSEV